MAVKRVPKASQQQVNQRAKDADWKRAQQLFESGELVSAKVEGANNGGVLIKLGSLLGFVPFSQIRANDGTKSLSEVGASLVGKTITAKVSRRTAGVVLQGMRIHGAKCLKLLYHGCSAVVRAVH